MVTIENDLGTFTADTEKEALAAVRKAQATKRKQDAADTILRERAFERARSNGFNILSRFLEKQEMPRGWVFYPPHAQYSAFKIIASKYPKGCNVEFHGEHGTAQADFYGHDMLGVVHNGAGFPIAFFLRDKERPGDVTGFALGIQDNVAAWVVLPTITIEMFRPSKQCEQETA